MTPPKPNIAKLLAAQIGITRSSAGSRSGRNATAATEIAVVVILAADMIPVVIPVATMANAIAKIGMTGTEGLAKRTIVGIVATTGVNLPPLRKVERRAATAVVTANEFSSGHSSFSDHVIYHLLLC